MIQEKTCVFFGHRDAPETLMPQIEGTITHLICEGVTRFYVGHHGRFDSMVGRTLKKLQARYSFQYAVVVTGFTAAAKVDEHPTVLPEGVEIGPPRFAIDRRNRWMVKQADVVVAYITHDWGGAAQYVEMARRKRIPILSLGDGDKVKLP